MDTEKYPGYTLEENLKKALVEMMILSLLDRKESYIGELTEAISERSGGAVNVVFPYGAIYRLERDGFLQETGKRTGPDGRRRQYIGITEAGRLYLQQLLKTYRAVIDGVSNVLKDNGESDKAK